MELHEKVTVRLFRDEKCFGPGMAELLEAIETHHSLRAAALSMDLAYSKAWTMVKRAEEQLGFPLLNRSTGGAGGGGAALTEKAVRLLAAYRCYEGELREFAREQFSERFSEFL